MGIKLKFSKERPEQSMGFLFWQVTHNCQRKISKALKPLNLTHMQFVLLAGLKCLAKQDKIVTQIMLASHANIDVMMASNVIRALEQKNFIIRQTHPTDTRAQQLMLTELGAQNLEKALDAVDEVEKTFFQSFGDSQTVIHEELLRLLLRG